MTFHPRSFTRFVRDITTGPSDLLIPAADLTPADPLGDALDGWCASLVANGLMADAEPALTDERIAAVIAEWSNA